MSSRKKAPGGRSHSTKGQRRAARKRLAGDTTEEEERHRGEASERERAESPDQSSTASLNAPSRSPRWPPLHSPRRSPASSPSTHSHLQFPTLSDAAAAGGQQQPANAFEKLFRFLCEDATSPTKGVEEDDEEDEDEEVSHLTSPSRSASEWMLLLLFLFALLLRYLVSGGAYSGMGKPPMFGDYEAQRHWMEITVNLPISEWYHNTTQNDLQYWGLDYPPLTAYVSWAFGKLAQFVGEGALVELGTSRGYESLTSKYFMRLTVLFCDAIIFLPAIYLALRAIAAANTPRWEVLMQTHLVWISPAFILIDHGHFQYNCVSLGLIVWAVYFHWRGQDFLGSIAFVASLAFKQMSLYFAPAFFAYLLARVMQGRGRRTVPIATSFTRLIVLGSIVLFTFSLFFLPFLTSLSSIGQVLHRIFPFARGLYEDKVANVWCATSILIKWHLWFQRETMVTASLVCTLVAFLPSCLHVFLRPSRRSFLYALGVCAWSFYLFSFQVHEKSVLLPLLPLALLISSHPLLYSLSGVIGVFSMYPLLEKDGQAMAYGSIRFFFGLQTLAYAKGRIDQPMGRVANNLAGKMLHYAHAKRHLLLTLAQVSSLVTVAMHAVWSLVPIPPRYPDLLVMGFMCYAAAHFVVFYLVLMVNQWAIPEDETEDEMLQPVGPREGKKVR